MVAVSGFLGARRIHLPEEPCLLAESELLAPHSPDLPCASPHGATAATAAIKDDAIAATSSSSTSPAAATGASKTHAQSNGSDETPTTGKGSTTPSASTLPLDHLLRDGDSASRGGKTALVVTYIVKLEPTSEGCKGEPSTCFPSERQPSSEDEEEEAEDERNDVVDGNDDQTQEMEDVTNATTESGDLTSSPNETKSSPLQLSKKLRKKNPSKSDSSVSSTSPASTSPSISPTPPLPIRHTNPPSSSCPIRNSSTHPWLWFKLSGLAAALGSGVLRSRDLVQWFEGIKGGGPLLSLLPFSNIPSPTYIQDILPRRSSIPGPGGPTNALEALIQGEISMK